MCVVGKIGTEYSLQAAAVEDDHVVQAFPRDGANQSYSIAVPPRISRPVSICRMSSYVEVQHLRSSVRKKRTSEIEDVLVR